MPSRTFFALLTLAACAAREGPAGMDSGSDAPGSAGEYAPCSGEPGACRLAIRTGGLGGDGCLCTHYCKADRDCPKPSTGTAQAYCKPFGDYVINGETGDCRLRCGDGVVCPDGMFCHMGECWAPLGK